METADETPITELAAWQARPCPVSFPFDEVVAEYRRAGKHFVSSELLEALDRVRRTLPPSVDAYAQIARFLDTCLDKFDGRYDNPSYLALEQLELPGADGCPDRDRAEHRRDRLLVLVLTDMLRFELAAADGETELQPELRPDTRGVAKRCRHALRAMRPALERLGLCTGLDGSDPAAEARQVCREVAAGMTPEEERRLQLTALPVSLVHDEYMFLRALQAYELTFALVGVQLRATVVAVSGGDAEAATEALEAATRVLAEASPIWSLTGTLQPEAFLRFREYTDGASAIQSRNYKLVESLCRQPDRERLDSPAYHSVPEIRDRVVAGQANLSEVLEAACAEGLIGRVERGRLTSVMDAFEAGVLKWRKTHHSIAVRMLGERRGTGYTEGVGYLEQVRTIPVFRGACPFGHGPATGAPAVAEPAERSVAVCKR